MKEQKKLEQKAFNKLKAEVLEHPKVHSVKLIECEIKEDVINIGVECILTSEDFKGNMTDTKVKVEEVYKVNEL